MIVSLIFTLLSIVWAILGLISGTKRKEVYNPNTKEFERW